MTIPACSVGTGKERDVMYDKQNRKSVFVHLVILAVLTMVVFANALTNEFVWDDALYLLNVDAYRTFNLGRFFFSPGNGFEYLPIRDVSYALDFALWGENSTGFHFTNLILYLLNIIAVYLLTATIIRAVQSTGEGQRQPAPATVAFWTAALFTLLPIHSETVNFIGCGRNTLLATLFTLLSARSFILFLVREESGFFSWRIAAAFFWYLLAVLSKATAISLPFFLFSICLIIGCQPLLKRLAVTIPFFFVSGTVYFQFTAIATRVGVISQDLGDSPSLAGKIATACQIPFFYLGKFILPTKMTTDYGMPFSSSLTVPSSVACLLAIGALALSAFVLRNRAPYLYIAFCWYGAFLIPVLHLLPTSIVVADRYAYLPSFAFCFLAAYAGSYLGMRRPYLIATTGVALCLTFGVLSFRQNSVWKSNQSLWEHTISISPRSVRAMENLGTIYYHMQEYDKAFNLFNGVRLIEPLNPIYDFFAGKYHYEQGNLSEAMLYLGHALEKKHDLIDALYFLANACERLGKRDSAVAYYRRVIESGDLERSQYKKLSIERLTILGKSNVP